MANSRYALFLNNSRSNRTTIEILQREKCELNIRNIGICALLPLGTTTGKGRKFKFIKKCKNGEVVGEGDGTVTTFILPSGLVLLYKRTETNYYSGKVVCHSRVMIEFPQLVS